MLEKPTLLFPLVLQVVEDCVAGQACMLRQRSPAKHLLRWSYTHLLTRPSLLKKDTAVLGSSRNLTSTTSRRIALKLEGPVHKTLRPSTRSYSHSFYMLGYLGSASAQQKRELRKQSIALVKQGARVCKAPSLPRNIQIANCWPTLQPSGDGSEIVAGFNALSVLALSANIARPCKHPMTRYTPVW